MMRCCKHCGALLEDESLVCPYCNTDLASPKTAEPVAQVATEAVAEATAEAAPRRKSSKKKLLIAGGIIAGVIAITVAVFLLFFNPAAAVDRYFSVVLDKTDQVASLAPDEYWEYKAKRSGYSKENYLERETESAEHYLTQWTEAKKKAYGDDFTFEYKIIDRELLTGDEADKIKNALDVEFKISQYRVSSIYRLFIKTTDKGSLQKDVYARQAYAVQIDSQWYLIHYYELSDGPWKINFIVDMRTSFFVT
jgi:hypothetical protein